MSAPPLTDLQVKVMVALHQSEHTEGYFGMTANRIGLAVGAERFSARRHGTGSTTRRFGPAHQIIPVLTGLRTRGLVDNDAPREDGLSGTAYRLTLQGRPVAASLAQADGGAA